MCVPNDTAAKYMKQKLIKLKWKIDKSMIIFGDFDNALSITDLKN